ncbi:hypothetical protein [Dyella sp. 2RAB6]|uniref:hypothetical protein n=1 Tax=Dyella sp. 2RAB6 TaxID=3232992 RepID=UPI003F900CAE
MAMVDAIRVWRMPTLFLFRRPNRFQLRNIADIWRANVTAGGTEKIIVKLMLENRVMRISAFCDSTIRCEKLA